MKTATFLFTLAILSLPASAALRTSTDYTLTAEATDGGGGQSFSSNYSILASAGVVSGNAASSTAYSSNTGFSGQQPQVTGLTVSAQPAAVDEGDSSQLAAAQTLDDGTNNAVDASAVTWTVLGGPVSTISDAGLATAGVVYQHTNASVQGAFEGFVGMVSIPVMNVGNDDFGSYAADGLPDEWQAQYFGIDNPDAAPAHDADGDGQDNRFEFTAGLVPTDSASRFHLHLEPVNGQPTRMDIVFRPIVSGRTYTVRSTTELGSSPELLPGTPPTSTTGDQRRVTDTDATGTRKFYDVLISKP